MAPTPLDGVEEGVSAGFYDYFVYESLFGTSWV